MKDPPDATASRILARLTREVGAERCAPLLDQRAILRCSGRGVCVTVPTGFVANLLDRRLGEELRRATREELGESTQDGSSTVRYVIDSGAFTDPPAHSPPPPPIAPNSRAKAARGGTKRPAAATPLRHHLDDFVVGDCNRLAFGAAQRIADPADRTSVSPLFIHGPSGVGKTHLLQGLAGAFRERSPRATVRYLAAEAFMNDYVLAVRTGKVDAFRRSYRGVDLLCIDDVHFLSTRPGTQSELMHTFDALDLRGARLALASDEHPHRIERLAAALASRFVSGMVVALDPPTPEILERIAMNLAKRRGLALDTAAAKHLAAQCPAWSAEGGSVRELEGMVTRVEAVHRLLADGPASPTIGVAEVRRALGLSSGAWAGRPRRPVRAEQIVREVCEAMRVPSQEVLGKDRHRRVVLARALVCHLCRRLTTLSYPEIARVLARRNHSSVIAACQRLGRQIEGGKAVAAGCDLDGMTLRAAVERLTARVVRSCPRE